MELPPALLNISANGTSALLANMTSIVGPLAGSGPGSGTNSADGKADPRANPRPLRTGRLISSAYRINSGKGGNIVDNWQETYGQPHEAFFYVELVCNVWFIIELTVRLVVSVFRFGFWI